MLMFIAMLKMGESLHKAFVISKWVYSFLLYDWFTFITKNTGENVSPFQLCLKTHTLLLPILTLVMIDYIVKFLLDKY